MRLLADGRNEEGPFPAGKRNGRPPAASIARLFTADPTSAEFSHTNEGRPNFTRALRQGKPFASAECDPHKRTHQAK
jgi:hypothetical protein